VSHTVVHNVITFNNGNPLKVVISRCGHGHAEKNVCDSRGSTICCSTEDFEAGNETLCESIVNRAIT